MFVFCFNITNYNEISKTYIKNILVICHLLDLLKIHIHFQEENQTSII